MVDQYDQWKKMGVHKTRAGWPKEKSHMTVIKARDTSDEVR